ncbi:hypothetical protein DESPIG_00001 [Desulfovibrio piger ATCC 29098]|uniref:Uncharacterized protein n=1 Tax=Desulfovibrio piger ATCC 29098 TaxID=411464 RepID=B6WPN6_9BACT|nr:hypothetical protein DESPIG_00001 [Desulfovibrio piger ATCC 29098]
MANVLSWRYRYLCSRTGGPGGILVPPAAASPFSLKSAVPGELSSCRKGAAYRFGAAQRIKEIYHAGSHHR